MSYNSENITFKKEERETINKKCSEILEATYKYLRKQCGPLVNDDLRIEIKEFKGILGENATDDDLKSIEDIEKQFGLKSMKGKERIFTSGEILEIYKTAILNNLLGDKYLVVRTSKYDDYFHGIDNIIIDKESGEIIAAVDDVVDIRSDRFFKKKSEIIEKNLENGVSIKYGIKLTGEGEVKEIIRVPNLDGLPIFYIAISEDILFELVEKFGKYTNEDKVKILDWIIQLIKLLLSEIELKLRFKRIESQEELEKLNARLNNLKTLKDHLEQKLSKLTTDGNNL